LNRLTVNKQLVFVLAFGACAALAMLASPSALRASSPSARTSLLRVDESPARGDTDFAPASADARRARVLLNLVLVEPAAARDAERGDLPGAHLGLRAAMEELEGYTMPGSNGDDKAPGAGDAARRTLCNFLAALVAAIGGMSIMRRLRSGAPRVAAADPRATGLRTPTRRTPAAPARWRSDACSPPAATPLARPACAGRSLSAPKSCTPQGPHREPTTPGRTRTMTNPCRTRGFTLIEMMITVAIIGILTALALPAYKNYVIRSKLVAGTNSLAIMRAQMEQYYLDNRSYATVSAPSIVTPCVQYAVSANSSNLFDVNCAATGDAPTSTTYTLRATGTGVVAGAVYTVDQSNSMVTVGFPTPWGSVPSSNACWIMRKGDSC